MMEGAEKDAGAVREVAQQMTRNAERREGIKEVALVIRNTVAREVTGLRNGASMRMEVMHLQT